MYSRQFWLQAGERCLKGFIVAFLGAAALGSTGPFNAFHINWGECAGVGLGGAMASLLLSFVSLPMGEPNSPSAVRLKPPAAANPDPDDKPEEFGSTVLSQAEVDVLRERAKPLE